MVGEKEMLAAPFFRFVTQINTRDWVSDDSFEEVGGLCRLETGVY